MTRFLYYYQLERYETTRFVKRVFKSYFKKLGRGKIKFDGKARFVLVVALVIFLIISSALIFFTPYYLAAPIIILLWLLRFIFLLIGKLAFRPLEIRMEKKKVESVSQKLTSLPNLVTVGITGSSGKSSIKEILKQLLPQNTISSDNENDTFMSALEEIENKLTSDHKIFLCEFGELKIGEITRLCQILKPSLGILPSINEHHLDHFKNIDKTVDHMFELLQNLEAEGTGIVNLDVELVNEKLKKALPTRLIGYSLENRENELCQKVVLATDINLGTHGSDFTLTINGTEYIFHSPLLGKNHVSNLLASIICAVELGEKPDELVRKIEELEQIPGRLEYKRYKNIDVLDDTQSSNVSGFKDALGVLSLYDGKKVIATLGIEGIGHKSSDVHKFLGFITSKTADLILLIGKSDRTDSISAGAIDNNFNKKNIIRLRDVREVYRFVDKNLKEGDVVLLENSLPERYL